MRDVPSVRAFSLLEVLFAVALFAVSISVMLALLLPLHRLSVQSADRLAAQRLPDALQAELMRLSRSGFDTLAAEIPVMTAPLDNGLAFVATRDGSRLHSRDYRSPASGLIADDDRYFLVECWRFPEGAVGYEAGQSSLPVAVRVSWPYRGPVASAGQQELMFTVAISR